MTDEPRELTRHELRLYVDMGKRMPEEMAAILRARLYSFKEKQTMDCPICGATLELIEDVDGTRNDCRNCGYSDDPDDGRPIHGRIWVTHGVTDMFGFDGLGLCPNCHDIETRGGKLCLNCRNEERDYNG